MPARCIVAGCNNTTKDGVSLHKFPSDAKSRRIWTSKVEQTRAKWTGPSDHSMICSAHFEPHCFHSASGFYNQFDLKIKPMLLQDAIPTIFPLTKKAAKRSERQKGVVTKREQITELQQAHGEDSPQLFSARRELHTCSSETRLGDQDDVKSVEFVDAKTTNLPSHEIHESRTKTLKKDICAAFGCSHRRSKTLCAFHSFPRDSEINQKWIEASRCNLCKHGKTTKRNFSSRNLRLCGCHFVKKPHPRSSIPRLKNIVPTLFNFPSDDLKTASEPVKRIAMMSAKPSEKLRPSKIKSHPDFYQRMKHFLSKEAYDEVDSCTPGFWNNYHQLKKEVMVLRAVCNSSKVLSLQNIKGNDSVFKTYTGLPNYATFEALCGYLALNAKSLKHTKVGIAFGELTIIDTTDVKGQINDTADVKRRTFTTEDQLFLFLVAVRTGSSCKDLAIRFSISESLVNTIISSWAVFVSETLDEFYTTMAPVALAPSVRHNATKDGKINVAVDYTALFSQSPALLTTQKDKTNDNRRLIAVGFSSTGVVTSVLSTLRGHAFARVSTKSKGSPSIQPHSKGHARQEQRTQIGTNSPKPGSVSTQVVSTDLSKSDTTLMSTQEVLHVERALNRIKQFRYLQQQVKPSLVDTYEQVFKACAYLINFQSVS